MATFLYENPIDPGSAGIDGRKLEKVVGLFRRQQESGTFPGGQFVLRRGGKQVLNEICGIAAAIVTNGNRSFIDLGRRFIPLAHGLRRACRPLAPHR